jgi:hypothetical protein
MNFKELGVAMNKARKYTEVDDFIKFIELPDNDARSKLSGLKLTIGDYSVYWGLPHDNILTMLESKRSHLKKELMELGVEV